MNLNSVSGQRLASFMAHDFESMCHFPLLESYMDSQFYAVTSYLSTKHIIKSWVKEPSQFYKMPINTYKTKSLRKAYQYFIVLCHWTYDQRSTQTFLEGWAFLLNQVVNEVKRFN